MTNKLDLKAITEYSNAYSQKVCNDFFDKKNSISGNEILNLTPVDQINMFIIKGLFDNWKSTTEKFKSPYFDFEHEKVKEALQNFMNIASQFISVKAAELLPLISKATAETIVVTLNPTEYFDGVFRELPDFKCTQLNLNQLKKYSRVNSNILEAMSGKLGSQEFAFTNQALNWLNEISDSINFDEPEPIISLLNITFPCHKTQFFKNKASNESLEANNDTVSFFDSIGTAEPKESEKMEMNHSKNKTEQNHEPVKVEKDAHTTLNEIYQSDQPTVNDHLKVTDKQNLVDLHQNAPVKNLAEFISLNQKFVFINKLFNGDSAAYNETLHILENCEDTDEALNLLKYKYAPKYQWNLNSIEADELIDILKRKA